MGAGNIAANSVQSWTVNSYILLSRTNGRSNKQEKKNTETGEYWTEEKRV
jgi:hypothetical protein